MDEYLHIVTNLEAKYRTTRSATNAFKVETVMQPKRPQCHMEQEENSTPRISVATSEKSCYDGIGLFGRLKRCCSLVEDAKSYAESGRECYPVLVLTLQPMEPNSVIRPTSEQVPDVQITGELWLTEPAVITSCRLKWLSPYSFRDKPLSAFEKNIIHERRDMLDRHVDSVSYVDPYSHPEKFDHPWLNGHGEILLSKNQEASPISVRHFIQCGNIADLIENRAKKSGVRPEVAWQMLNHETYNHNISPEIKTHALAASDWRRIKTNCQTDPGRVLVDTDSELYARIKNCFKTDTWKPVPDGAIEPHDVARSCANFILLRPHKRKEH